MDNVCHTLVGAAFGEAGLKHRTRFGAATLMIAANLPDIDVLGFFSQTPSVALRRGWTHGVLAQALLPCALTAAVLVIAPRVRPRHAPSVASAPWLLALSYIGVLSHVLLDFLNNYGIRLLMPFERRWFYGDAVFIIDPWLWLVLGLGVWLAHRRVAPLAARGALLIAALYIAAMFGSGRAARLIVADTWRTEHGREAQSLMVGPSPINPFDRTIIVDAGDHYETGTFSWLPRRVAFSPAVVPKNDKDPRVTLARETPRVRAFLVWSRFPFWVLEPAPGGTRVSVSDMRFAGQNPVRFTQSTIVPADTK